jgi:hypothetical protein
MLTGVTVERLEAIAAHAVLGAGRRERQSAENNGMLLRLDGEASVIRITRGPLNVAKSYRNMSYFLLFE